MGFAEFAELLLMAIVGSVLAAFLIALLYFAFRRTPSVSSNAHGGNVASTSAQTTSSATLGSAPAPVTGALPTSMDGYGYLSVVGESQYQPALQQIAERGRICWAKLVPEPANGFDPTVSGSQSRWPGRHGAK